MDVIFTGNVSKEGQRVVQAGRERERRKTFSLRGWSFCLCSILLALESMGKTLIFKPHFKM